MVFKCVALIIGVLLNVSFAICVDVEDNNNDEIEVTTLADKPLSVKAIDDNELVKIQLYYESLCMGCRSFDSTTFKKTVIELSSYLNLHLYPYGNAKTVDNGGGNYTFTCQHGPAECYGNKLHACAIDILPMVAVAAIYNSCLMDYTQAGHGSDDAAADVCGLPLGINSDPIKQCAKSYRGTQLLKFYGDESKKAGFKYVPYILINGIESSGDHFRDKVCKAFKNPPPQCKK